MLCVLTLLCVLLAGCAGDGREAKHGAISDKADDSEEMSYLEFEKAAAAHCAAIVRYMVAH